MFLKYLCWNIDPAEGNNTACITVILGEIAETTCDLEAVFRDQKQY